MLEDLKAKLKISRNKKNTIFTYYIKNKDKFLNLNEETKEIIKKEMELLNLKKSIEINLKKEIEDYLQ